MNDLFENAEFEPTLAAAQARLTAVRPSTYAGTRNSLSGAVTKLSPYLTHGLLSLPVALTSILQRSALDVNHKLVYEFGWREYFQHVWQHEGDGIFESLHEGLLPDSSYSPELPADIRQARTGVPVIDRAVRQLYATGYLHNHARMWLASYVVHLRKVHWRAGADWMYGHLIDGDLGSNHLSWQWVAGTGSPKPYLFNADNVARYAPAEWHSKGSVIDTSYGELERMARSPEPVAGGGGAEGVAEPALFDAPPAGLCSAPDRKAVLGRDLALVHAWALGPTPPGLVRLAVLDSEFHRRWPWSAARWKFVGTALKETCELRWCGNAADTVKALAGAVGVRGVRNPHLGPAWDKLRWQSPTHLLQWPEQRCASFSQFWTRATQGLRRADELGRSRPAD
jgi:deoxyribodipyrimidine photo-lyase